MSEKIKRNFCINHQMSTMDLVRRVISLGVILQLLGNIGKLKMKFNIECNVNRVFFGGLEGLLGRAMIGLMWSVQGLVTWHVNKAHMYQEKDRPVSNRFNSEFCLDKISHSTLFFTKILKKMFKWNVWKLGDSFPWLISNIVFTFEGILLIEKNFILLF